MINTNIPSITAQRNLNKSQNSLETSLQRLSSGLRINSAKDDAAGLAITQTFTSQVRGLNQAVRNANDGISVSQTAEGALDESGNNLQRIRELSIQSANGSNGASERAALQAEVSQLLGEIDRIATTTRFGSRLLLDGSFGSASFQVGAQAFETIAVNLSSARTQDLGSERVEANDGVALLNLAATTGGAGSQLAGDTLAISGQLGSENVTYAAGASAAEIAEITNAYQGGTGVSASARTVALVDGLSADDTISLDLTGFNTTAVSISANITTTDYSALANAVNKVSAQTGITAELSEDKASINLISETGDNIQIDNYTSGTTTTTLDIDLLDFDGGTLAGTTSHSLADGALTDDVTVTGIVRFDSSASYTITNTNTDIFAAAAAQGSSLEQLSNISVSTAVEAQEALVVVDKALEAVASQRADLGAVQNRLQSTIQNLSNISENVSAARSRVQDADFASETSNLAKQQILQQAGISVLSTANSQPQQVLSLLQ